MIDADYRGKVHVLLFNHSDSDYIGARSSYFVSLGQRELTL